MRSRLLNDDIQYIDPEEKKKDLINWTVDKPHFFSIPEDLYYIAHASRWGTGYTSVAMDWLRTLSWPMQKDENKPPVGITWVELAFNFLITTQRSIPINIRENGATRYKNNEDDFGFDVRAHSFTRMENSFRDSLEHIRYLTQCDIMPTMDPCKVKSICILGSAHLKQGVAYRPTMLKQKETMDAVLSYLRPTETGKPPSFWNHPEIPKFEPLITQRIQEPANNTLAERSTRYNRRRKEIKLSRSHWLSHLRTFLLSRLLHPKCSIEVLCACLGSARLSPEAFADNGPVHVYPSGQGMGREREDEWPNYSG